MSLASRVTNFFSAPRGERNSLGFADADDGLPGGKGSFVNGTLGVVSETMAQKAVEKEGRPPYLHVRNMMLS
jgi:hypothetical protein